MDRSTLETLHEVIAMELLERVKSGEATASELSVAVKFLKDNNANLGVISADSPVANLLENLPFDVGSHLN